MHLKKDVIAEIIITSILNFNDTYTKQKSKTWISF